jgi:hypothetical protein
MVSFLFFFAKKQEVKKFPEIAPGMSGGVQRKLLEQCQKDSGRSDGVDILIMMVDL